MPPSAHLLLRLLAATILTTLALAGGSPPPASAAAPETRRGPLLLDSSFAGGRLDAGTWGTCHWWADPQAGCSILSNDELEWYRPEQARQGGGLLRLVAERRTTLGHRGRRFPYASGMISSGPPFESRRPRFAFRYGYAAMRARVPRGRGLWPAFWLLPARRESKPEIDVMEILGHDTATLRMHLHHRDAHGRVHSPGANWRATEDLSRGFHVYAVDWAPGRLRWLLDGREVWRVEGAAVPDEPMYLVANLAVGGWAGRPPRATTFPSVYLIDYIRVWGREPS